MNADYVQIPARIIHNWDFKAYPISRRAINYLNEVKDHPVIDFKVKHFNFFIIMLFLHLLDL